MTARSTTRTKGCPAVSQAWAAGAAYMLLEACLETGRRFLLVDNNVEALRTMARRFAGRDEIAWEGFDPAPFQSPAGAGPEGARPTRS